MSARARLGYWKRGAAALRPFGYPDAYCCPLCLRLFGQDQIDELVLGHALPESLGGELEVLVCWDCEHGSKSGHELDAHAYKFDVARRILAGEPYPVVRARFTIEGITFNADLSSDRALDNQIVVLPDCNPDHVLDQLGAVFDRCADGGMPPREMRFTLPKLRPVPRRAQVSYLRAAYLTVFAVFGYSAIALRSFDRVRQQIREPDADHVPEFFYRHDNLHGCQAYRVGIVCEPAWHSSIMVLMGDKRITLPLYDNGDVYERIAERAAVGGQWTLQGHCLEVPRWPSYGRVDQLARSMQQAAFTGAS